MLVLEGAEEPLDDPAGLRGLDAGADVPQQRAIAGERHLVGLAAAAGSIVTDDGDRGRDGAQQLAGGLVDRVQLAAIFT
jgi:hypothetical protein